MSCKEHKFKHKKTEKKVSRHGPKAVFTKTEYFECANCMARVERQEFDYTAQPPTWWMKETKDNG